jgi:hypothetical protein
MSRKLVFRWWWQCWTFGIVFPCAGMIVWQLCLGPLHVEFWPHAGYLHDEAPF